MTSVVPSDATHLTIVGAPEVPRRKPRWLKRDAPLAGANYREIKRRMRDLDLHTVCEEASCPNIHECWEDREATFLIGGPDCTRRCGFCEIATGKPKAYDREEPARVADAVAAMGLHFAVVTGVARDDLADKAAWLYAETCRQIKQRLPDCGVELLIDDFRGDGDLLDLVLEARPEVLAHNLETPRRLFRHVRPGFDYDGSLELLARAKARGSSATKSNLMLGMGETFDEVVEAMRDLREAGCDLVTINQYLPPSHRHLALQRYVPPEEFEAYRRVGAELGFAHVESGPLVRSSYRAGAQAEAAGVWRRPGPDSQTARAGGSGPATAEVTG